jgi:hypothetical protein
LSDAQNIYWLFSAAAQTVAALIAFLLAAYGLVQGIMDVAAQSDETLLEINESLKEGYHQQLSWLVSITAAAIISSLTVVFLYSFNSRWVKGLAVISSVLVLAAIVGGVVFVIAIVDPKKYRKAARRLVEEVEAPVEQPHASRNEFFVKFIELERFIRELWQQSGSERLSQRRGPPTFREMIEALSLSEVLPHHLQKRLLVLSRYRNLVFHGEVTQVSSEIVSELDATMDEIRVIRDEAERQTQIAIQ